MTIKNNTKKLLLICLLAGGNLRVIKPAGASQPHPSVERSNVLYGIAGLTAGLCVSACVWWKYRGAVKERDECKKELAAERVENQTLRGESEKAVRLLGQDLEQEKQNRWWNNDAVVDTVHKNHELGEALAASKKAIAGLRIDLCVMKACLFTSMQTKRARSKLCPRRDVSIADTYSKLAEMARWRLDQRAKSDEENRELVETMSRWKERSKPVVLSTKS